MSKSWDWVEPCKISKTAGWCLSGAGCPIMLRYINHSDSFRRGYVSVCPFLHTRHPKTDRFINGYQLDLFKNEVKP